MLLTNRYKIESILLQEKNTIINMLLYVKKKKNLSTKKIYIYIFWHLHFWDNLKNSVKK